MTTTLATMIQSTRDVLGDDGTVYSEGALTAGIRLALAEYALATGTTATVQGLDGAAETTLPAIHEMLLARGAAGYCACSQKAGALAQRLPEDFGASKDLLEWGESTLADFSARLRGIAEGARVSGLRQSQAPWGDPWDDPWRAWEDD